MYRETYVLLLLLAWIDSSKIEVKVKQGRILGGREITVFNKRLYFVFYRVPYAQRPIKKLRFKDPVPHKKWEKVVDGRTEFHGTCAQAHIVHKSGQFGVEDCLYLNIFTPEIPKSEEAKLKPVIVWLHGYAFASSFSHLHGADFLIDNDIVLVTVTHRIGVFGFLKLNDTDTHANMGLKDIVMALKWIRTNIKHFGGNKKNITLMGNNSAATFITLLMMTEASKLFSKVILQSGSIYSASMFKSNFTLERRRLKRDLKKNGLKLEKATTKQLIDASRNIYSRSEIENFQRPIVPFTPVIEPESESALLTRASKDFYDTMKSKKYNKPVLIGFNTQESISEAIPFIHNQKFLKPLSKFFKFMVPFSDGCRYNSSSKKYKEISNKIKNRYFKGGISEKSLDNFLRYTSDLIKYPIIKFIRTYLSIGKGNMYMYKFDYRGTLNAVKATSLGESNAKVKGVASGDEICYVLKCEALWENYVGMTKFEVNADKTFIKDMVELWSNFAKFGNPTPKSYVGNVTWPPMNLEGNNVLLMRKTYKMIDFKPENSVYAFWNHIYETFYDKSLCQAKKKKHDEL
ncbi:unnamed protein product [Chrysodeixis includens]|uniref:Carboxylesterase type B domain-containing protein n=1 Tax=Chrysodeixis includens TaxID=689277 RepID=A0A9N8PYF2_CHRIL|nr:unnamed protein product [Chrysodeixis includens]